MKFSLYAFGVSLFLSMISMGLWGQFLHIIVSPFLNLKFPPLSAWHGDWVWPASFYSGILWSFGFLISGWIFVLLQKTEISKFVLYFIYIVVLLVWDAIVWSLVLKFIAKY